MLKSCPGGFRSRCCESRFLLLFWWVWPKLLRLFIVNFPSLGVRALDQVTTNQLWLELFFCYISTTMFALKAGWQKSKTNWQKDQRNPPTKQKTDKFVSNLILIKIQTIRRDRKASLFLVWPFLTSADEKATNTEVEKSFLFKLNKKVKSKQLKIKRIISNQNEFTNNCSFKN